MKNKTKLKLFILFILPIFIWMAGTSMVQRFKCKKLTETELFCMLPKNFILDFKICD